MLPLMYVRLAVVLTLAAALPSCRAQKIPTASALPAASTSSGPTALAPGDVAFVGFTTHGTQNDQFAFVLLRDVGKGTALNITDQNWDGTRFIDIDGGVIRWTADREYSSGTVIQVLPTSNGSKSSVHSYAVNIYSGGITYTNVTGPGVQSGTFAFDPTSPIQVDTVTNSGGGLTGLKPAGDQLIAYQGPTTLEATAEGVTFVAALNYGAAWVTQVPPTVAVGDNGNCVLPTGLTNGISAVAFTSGWGNGGTYDGSIGTAGNVKALDSSINGCSHWRLSMASANLPVPVVAGGFTVQ